MSVIKRGLRSILRRLGYRISRVAVEPTDSMDRKLDQMKGLLQSASGTPVFLDVGARGGPSDPWMSLQHAGLVNVVGIEPESGECRSLESRFPGVRFLPWALGDTESEQKLYVTRMPGCSSLLEPNWEVLRDYPVKAWFEIVAEQMVPVRRYDRLVRDRAAPQPTFVKLDVQGYEWNVLEGFGTLLDEVLAIELEAHFAPLYSGQKTAMDLIPYLRRRGFVLRHVVRHGPFEEEFLEGNFFFSRRHEILPSRERYWLAAWEAASGIPPPFPFTSV